MSLIEQQHFVDTMHELGYKRFVSVLSFTRPNFELVADCLLWLVRRCEQDVDISREMETEEQRVTFLTQASKILYTQFRLKLDLRRLYEAEHGAVQELMKVASLLYDAKRQTDVKGISEDAVADVALEAVDWKLMRHDNERLQEILSTLKETGAKLHEALQREGEHDKEMRQKALEGVAADSDELQTSLEALSSTLDEDIRYEDDRLNEIQESKRRAERQLNSVKTELHRCDKRLSALQSVRPSYMDEYEEMKEHIHALHSKYIDHHRNIQYLEWKLEKQHAAEASQKKSEERELKKLQKQWRKEEEAFFEAEEAASCTTDASSEDDHQNKPGVEVEVIDSKNNEAVTFIDGHRIMGHLVGDEEDSMSEDSSDELSSNGDDTRSESPNPIITADEKDTEESAESEDPMSETLFDIAPDDF